MRIALATTIGLQPCRSRWWTPLLTRARSSRPGSHLSADAEEKEEAVAVAVPAGTVTLYSPSIVHRGRANLHPSAPRLSLTFTILGAGGLLPTGIPYAGQPEDEWRWSLVNGELRDEWRP